MALQGTRLLAILASGEIKRASARLMKPERPAVWFSTRQSWEPTATKMLRDAKGALHTMTIDEMVAHAAILVRKDVSRGRVFLPVGCEPA